MIQTKFAAVSAQPFTSDGDSEGNLTVADSTLFKVQQIILLKSSAQQPRELQIKRISGPNQIKVGKLKSPIHEGVDISDFLVADGATIQSKEQDRPTIPPDAFQRAVYDEEPTVAIRTTSVDALGNKYSTKNPMPVRLSDGDINIGTVNGELEVQLSHKDGDPDSGDVHDSIRIGDGVNEATVTKAITGTKAGLNINSINDAFSKPFNKLTVLTKNDDGDPLTIRSSYFGTPVQLATVIYDSDGDFQDIEVSDL